MDSIYETLLDLPVFKGVSYTRLSEIVEKTPFHFLRYSAGEVMVKRGDACTGLKCVISGQTRVTVESLEGRLRVSQTLTAPAVIAPDFLFGRMTVYPCTATAIGDNQCGLVEISKADYMRILAMDEICMFNFLNLLSRNAQKAVEGVLSITEGAIDERIAFWIAALTQTGATDIVMECRHRDLYAMFGVPRAMFLQALESMRRKGLVDYTPGKITVKSRKDLIDMLFHRR